MDRILSENINCEGDDCARDIAAFVNNVVKPRSSENDGSLLELHKIIESDVKSTCSLEDCSILPYRPVRMPRLQMRSTRSQGPRKVGFAPCSRNRSEVITTRH